MRRVRLDVVERIEVEKAAELVDARQALPAGDRHARRASKLGVALGVVVAQRLLHEQQVERLDGAGEVERRGARPGLADLHRVAVGRELDVRPERLAQRPELGALVGDAARGAAGIPGAVRRGAGGRREAAGPPVEAGPDLEPAEAERVVAEGLGDGLLDRPGPRATRGVEGESIVGGPAEQLVDRLAGDLARDVPARHLEPGQDRQPETGPRPPERALVELAERRLGLAGVERQGSEEVGVVIDQRSDDLGMEVAHDRLAHAGDTLVGLDDDERGGPSNGSPVAQNGSPVQGAVTRTDRTPVTRIAGRSAGRVDDEVAGHRGDVGDAAHPGVLGQSRAERVEDPGDAVGTAERHAPHHRPPTITARAPSASAMRTSPPLRTPPSR